MKGENKGYTFSELKQKLVNYCVYQDRCHAEVEQKMREYLLIPEAKEAIYLYLIQENFLNEERFVRSYIRGKFYIKKWGKQKIKNHLKNKQIQTKLIDSCFDEIHPEDYFQTIRKIAETHFYQQKGLQKYQKTTKTIRYLMSRGYEYELILEVMQEIPE